MREVLINWLYITEDQPINADRFLDKRQELAEGLACIVGHALSRTCAYLCKRMSLMRWH